ncbi:SGNH/GDSL hydrolase family protein [Desertibaculum subflavum]|uniref:SGNH/GDSL hydrolase family protein n=1 Tax=Desertibaculum subflavum TaxID=2268458 RepID=UPI0034D1966F
MRNFIAGLFVLLFTLILSAAGLELLVRLAYGDGSNFDIEMWRYARELKRVSVIPGVGHEHRANTSGVYMGVPVTINSAGLRGREYAPDKSPGTVRILMLGDSVTFGWGTPEEGTTSTALERNLNAGAASARFEVINTGVGNTNTAMQVAYFLHKGVAFQADVVVLNYFINDAEETPTKQDSWLTDWSYAAVFIAGRLDILERSYFGKADWREYYRDLYRPGAPGWQEAERRFAELAAFCRERGVRLLVVNYPELHELADYPFPEVTARVAALAESEKLPFLDLLPSIRSQVPDSLWVTPTDSHPNAKAAELFSAAIADKLRTSYPDLFASEPPEPQQTSGDAAARGG